MKRLATALLAAAVLLTLPGMDIAYAHCGNGHCYNDSYERGDGHHGRGLHHNHPTGPCTEDCPYYRR